MHNPLERGLCRRTPVLNAARRPFREWVEDEHGCGCGLAVVCPVCSAFAPLSGSHWYIYVYVYIHPLSATNQHCLDLWPSFGDWAVSWVSKQPWGGGYGERCQLQPLGRGQGTLTLGMILRHGFLPSRNGWSLGILTQMEWLYKQGKIQMENSSGIIWAFLFFPRLHKILYFCRSAAISLEKKSQCLLAISQNLDIKNHRFTKKVYIFSNYYLENADFSSALWNSSRSSWDLVPHGSASYAHWTETPPTKPCLESLDRI